MSSVELLSREGEIAIAKRIEAGREAMIAGLCESPLTFQAIIIWRDELNGAKVFFGGPLAIFGPSLKSPPSIFHALSALISSEALHNLPPMSPAEEPTTYLP